MGVPEFEDFHWKAGINKSLPKTGQIDTKRTVDFQPLSWPRAPSIKTWEVVGVSCGWTEMWWWSPVSGRLYTTLHTGFNRYYRVSQSNSISITLEKVNQILSKMYNIRKFNPGQNKTKQTWEKIHLTNIFLGHSSESMLCYAFSIEARIKLLFCKYFRVFVKSFFAEIYENLQEENS